MHHYYRSFILAITATQLALAQYTSPSFANFSGPNGPLVDLGYVKVQGTHVTSASFPLNAWLGVRYAASPGGQNRFKAPIPIEATLPAHTTFDASNFGPYCYQTFVHPAEEASILPLLGLGNRQPSEDCLLMDIFAPANPVSKALPVLLIIHGGAYVVGSSTTGSTLGLLAAAPGQFITVQMQYRLGGFGFLGGSDVQSNGNLNAGLLDQRLAMEWVQNHISKFGGDPNHVVLQGASAGGGNVTAQLLWNGGEANPPYKAVIAESPFWQPMINIQQQNTQYKEILLQANCQNIACLRSLSATAYATAEQNAIAILTTSVNQARYYGPVVDGYHIQNLFSLELAAGHFARVPMLVDDNGNEGLIFTPQNITTEEEFEAQVETLFTALPYFFAELYALYPDNPTADYVYGDAVIQCPSYYLASHFVAAGLPVYKYIFAYPTFQYALHYSNGEVLFVSTPYAATDMEPAAVLSRNLQAYYTSYIINVNPNTGEAGDYKPAVNFPLYGRTGQILIFNQSTPVQIRDVNANARCDFFFANPGATNS